MRGIADMQVMLDHVQRSAGTQFDQVAVMPGQVVLAGYADKDQLQRNIDLRTFLHAHQHAFVGKRGIDAGEDFIAAFETATEQLLRVIAGSQRGGQGLQLHAVGQCGQVAQCVRRAPVDEHQPWRGDIVQHGGIDQRRYQGRSLKTAPLQLPQRGVFPGFGARAGQAGLQRGIEFGTPYIVAAETACEGFQQGAHQAAASGTTRSLRKW